jgi:PAS domain S-box-containing protein
MKDTNSPQDKMRALNEALLLGSLRQHELAEAAETLNEKLKLEIAERKLAEAALNRLAAIVEFSSDGIISVDMNGIITTWNNGAKILFGYTSEEMIGSSILQLLPDDWHDEDNQVLAKLRVTESVNHFETLRKTKDDRQINVSVTISPIKDAAGSVIGASKVVRDITDRKQADRVKARMDVLEMEIVQQQAKEDIHLAKLQNQKQLHEQTRHFAQQILQAQEEERLRISRELHDQVVQTLIAINIRLVSLEKQAETLGSNFQQHFTLAQKMVERTVENVYQFSRDLRPTVLDDLGLIPALHSFLKTFTEDTGIHASLTGFSGVEKLNITLITVLYRVAQEALNNVARHAKAKTVDISIQKFEDGMVCMTIKDNGQGFKPDTLQAAKKGKRLGVIGMQERLEMVEGRFDIQYLEGQGTTVTALIPFGTETVGVAVQDG